MSSKFVCLGATIASLCGTVAFAGSSLTSELQYSEISVQGMNAVNAYATSLQYKNILENKFALIGEFSYLTGDASGLSLTGTSFTAGVGYAALNTLDLEANVGGSLVLGAAFQNDRIEVGGLTLSDSTTLIGAIGEMALGSGMIGHLRLSIPTDAIGDAIYYEAGVSFPAGWTEVQVGLVGGQQIVEGTSVDRTGFSVGFTNRF